SNRRAFSAGENVVDGGVELLQPSTWHDDRVSPAVCFLSDPQKTSAIIFAELYIKVFPLNLKLLRFDDVVHFDLTPILGRTPEVRKAKNSPKFHAVNG